MSVEAGERAAFDQRRLEVLVSYSRSLRWQMWSISLVIALLAGAGGAGWDLSMGWLAAFLLVRELRARALVGLLGAPQHSIDARLRQVTHWTLALGLAHGAAALLMLRTNTEFAALLSMVLMGLSAGAVSTTYTVVPAFKAYALGIAVPVVAVWLFSGGWVGPSVALLVAMFTGVQIRFARQNMAMFEESYAIRLKNLALLKQLDEERQKLSRARDAAVQADLAKSRFLASASHDLRQPLQSLLLNAGELSRLALPGEVPQMARDMVDCLEALRQMLDALLEASKLDAGAVAPQIHALPLERLLQGLVIRFKPSALSKGLSLDADCPPGLSVLSDVDLLQRVLSNLIDNAIKFTERGGVKLIARREAGHVWVEVSDTGPGIALTDQSRVFEDLVQLGNPERNRAQGHGLGLGIVRRLVHVLGAECRLESVPGQGTCFRVRLTEAGPNGQDPAVLDEGRFDMPSLVARSVLVVDDDEKVRLAYQRTLQNLGCEVHCCASVAAALDKLDELRPEIALIDFRLAGRYNGLEALVQLRDRQAGLPAVIVSADASPALRAAAARVGVSVLRKPVSEALLAMAINDTLLGDSRGETDESFATRRRAA